jgi:hypothetical protein
MNAEGADLEETNHSTNPINMEQTEKRIGQNHIEIDEIGHLT